ncbi:hypothetical protein C8Q74DRAFT_887613 [Fomes fomentarius]|nr:hypothetical protein C8Q74DRAFT_887613 [Fomes fomentarius]
MDILCLFFSLVSLSSVWLSENIPRSRFSCLGGSSMRLETKRCGSETLPMLTHAKPFPYELSIQSGIRRLPNRTSHSRVSVRTVNGRDERYLRRSRFFARKLSEAVGPSLPETGCHKVLFVEKTLCGT